MSIITAFDGETPAIIEPRFIAPPIPDFPKTAIVTFSESVITALKEHYEPSVINHIKASITIPVYKISYKGADIAVYCTAIGGPSAVGLMEEMISKGCEKFVFFGACGVLNREIAENSLIVPTAAYRDEGTSYHYLPASDYVEIPTAEKLSAILTEFGLPNVFGKTWTTDAIYRETRGNAEKRKAEGCIAVEMECASIMACAEFRKVEAYQFLYAADSLDGAEWDRRTFSGLPQDEREKFFRIALETAVKI